MAQNISFQAAVALAKSGDADAQYALSSLLHERGQFDESLHWLRLAAAQELIPAQIALAAMLMDGRRCPRDLQRCADLLLPLAAAQPEANLLLSELYGFAALKFGDRAVGLRYLFAAARMGDACALRQMGLLSAFHRRWELVRPLLDAAARGADAAAAYALGRCYADGIGGHPDPAIAVTLSRSDAARSQHLGTRLERSLLPEHPASSFEKPPVLTIDWPLLERELSRLAADTKLPTAETLNVTPLVRRLPGVVHALVLDAVINLSAPLVQRSQIIDARTGEIRVDPMRTSSHITLGPRQHDHVLEAIEQCLSRVTGVPSLNGEFLQILRYRPGEEFRPHVDYFNEGGAEAHQSLADGGQRAQTVLLHLNDDYTGGNTIFPRLQLDVSPHAGDLVHFHNLAADGLGHKDSLHAGVPVIAGEKWLLSQWVRSGTYPARLLW